MNTSIIKGLIAKQNESHLSNADFASHLGISRSMWELLKQGKRELGVDSLRAVAKVYPDLLPLFLLYISPMGS